MLDLLKAGISSGLRIREALSICHRAGHMITAQGLFYNGMRHDFVGKFPGSNHYFFAKERLEAWLASKTEVPSEEWEPLVEVAKKVNHSKNTIYGWVMKKWISSKRIGTPPGRVYVRSEEVKNRIANLDKRGGHGGRKAKEG